MRKKKTAFRLPPELLDWMAKQDKSQTELVIDGLKLLSKIDWETIKSLAGKHRIHPDLLVDTAIMYFSQLNSAEQKFKIADYLEKDLHIEIEREKSATENHKSDSAE